MVMTETGAQVYNLLQQGQAFVNPAAQLTAGISSAVTGLTTQLPMIVSTATNLGVAGVEQLGNFAALATGQGLQAGMELAGHTITTEVYDKFLSGGIGTFVTEFEAHTASLVENMHTYIPFVGSYRNMRQEVQNAIPATSTMAMAADAVNADSSNACSFLNNIFGSIMGAVKDAMDFVKGAINAVIGPIKDLYNQIMGDIAGAMNAIKSAISSVVNQISGMINGLMNQIMSVANQVMNEIRNLANMMTEMIHYGLSGLLSRLKFDPCTTQLLSKVSSPELSSAIKLTNITT